MFTARTHRLDFADTRFANFDSMLALSSGTGAGASRFDTATDAADAFDQLAQADAADFTLLKQVACAAGATLVLALALALNLGL